MTHYELVGEPLFELVNWSGSMHWSEIQNSDNRRSENARSENTRGASEWPLMVKQSTIKIYNFRFS